MSMMTFEPNVSKTGVCPFNIVITAPHAHVKGPMDEWGDPHSKEHAKKIYERLKTETDAVLIISDVHRSDYDSNRAWSKKPNNKFWGEIEKTIISEKTIHLDVHSCPQTSFKHHDEKTNDIFDLAILYFPDKNETFAKKLKEFIENKDYKVKVVPGAETIKRDMSKGNAVMEHFLKMGAKSLLLEFPYITPTKKKETNDNIIELICAFVFSIIKNTC